MSALLTVLVSFCLTAAVEPLLIRYFRRHHEGQKIRQEGPKWHAKKSGTPTMGGIGFIVVIVVTVLAAAATHSLHRTLLVALLVLLGFGLIGFADDGMKLFYKRNMGLKAWQKLLGQIVISAIFLWVYFSEKMPYSLYIPFVGVVADSVFFAAFALFWLVGFSNAVNLTDGLDGLVSGLGIIAFGVYAIIAWQDARTDVLLICLAVVGALAAFLLFNHKPAKIFMGDVGSLALGGLLAAVSIMLHREWSLLLVGIVFVCETASVILQVGSFKLTGKRLFKMTPIHHHFEMLGWSEWRVVLTFWTVGALGGILYLMIW
ncbi:phospho-N-acetylmuramoyl-pentapeptide-transferase [Schleiferilactobacillus shenzhenensis]|uniref:Phospho-N-acetylmuramoyl-pentapeptide-transferase n=1 Tax=Schleiferilactobacillus shenzhenensis LY-73 TaxID=1231336 RepID=U4TQJ3_9LACO|nr:phospho-N-acetylmuramoyl-pentapeptide-transferase [Schleiferilactobacillus shenzhenensis]ERL66474.1 MraY [Schleiferilactobacillus shenzhenensis LY-73]